MNCPNCKTPYDQKLAWKFRFKPASACGMLRTIVSPTGAADGQWAETVGCHACGTVYLNLQPEHLETYEQKVRAHYNVETACDDGNTVLVQAWRPDVRRHGVRYSISDGAACKEAAYKELWERLEKAAAAADGTYVRMVYEKCPQTTEMDGAPGVRKVMVRVPGGSTFISHYSVRDGATAREMCYQLLWDNVKKDTKDRATTAERKTPTQEEALFDKLSYEVKLLAHCLEFQEVNRRTDVTITVRLPDRSMQSIAYQKPKNPQDTRPREAACKVLYEACVAAAESTKAAPARNTYVELTYEEKLRLACRGVSEGTLGPHITVAARLPNGKTVGLSYPAAGEARDREAVFRALYEAYIDPANAKAKS